MSTSVTFRALAPTPSRGTDGSRRASARGRAARARATRGGARAYRQS
jgi:hypothetical protein